MRNRYDSYKDSGLEWIGEIPTHWSTDRLKWVSEIENSGVWGEDNEFPNSVNVPIPTTGQLSIDGEWYYDKMNLRNLSNDEWNKYKCIVGDIVVVKSSGSSTNIITGKCGFISEEDSEKFGFSNFLMRVRPEKMIPKLVYYFLSSNLTKQRIERMVSSTTYPNLKVDEYSNSELLIPPLSEQQQIVSFLDTKTSLIDSLIEKTQRKIELLKEKRTSLINELVTKGLNPIVEMKDSGVEWIGEIPSHWGRLPLKQFGDVTLGKMLTSEDKGGYHLKPYLRSKNIQVERVDISDMKEMWFSDSEVEKLKLEKGDLLFNEGGDVGRTCIWLNEIDECYIQNSVNRVRFENDDERYFLHLSILYHSVGYYDSLVNRVSIPHLTKEKLESVTFLRPPLSEQQQIVEYLDEQTQLIDNTISIEEKRIELLKEYRQSLISEVVTGKLKVTTDE